MNIHCAFKERDKEQPLNRHSIRLRDYDYSQPGSYFVTICISDRRCVLGHILNGISSFNQLGIIVGEYWESIPQHFPNVFLDKYVIMPNHLHGIITINDDKERAGHRPAPTKQRPLSEIIGRFKLFSAKEINTLVSSDGPFWQRNYYEHVIRSDDDLNVIREYIDTNPLKWSLDRENPARTGESLLEKHLFDRKTKPDRLQTNHM
jgi:putative transposase